MELLVALALGAIVAAILVALLQGLLAAGDRWAGRWQGPSAARAALRTLAREISCAFAPPSSQSAPFELVTSAKPGQPSLEIRFYAPVAGEAAAPRAYDISQVIWRVQEAGNGRKELLRVAAPCSGPLTNSPTTNCWLRGHFSLDAEALAADGSAHLFWPPAQSESSAEAAQLPAAIRFALAFPGREPLKTETVIHSAWTIHPPEKK